MLEIDRKIKDIDKTICDNIALIDFKGVTRALISQNLLSQSRNLVEHIAVKISGQGNDIDVNWETIPAAIDFIKQNNKYLFLRQFHTFLQESLVDMGITPHIPTQNRTCAINAYGFSLYIFTLYL